MVCSLQSGGIVCECVVKAGRKHTIAYLKGEIRSREGTNGPVVQVMNRENVLMIMLVGHAARARRTRASVVG